MRGSPLKQGPHCPADSSARYRATRAVSAIPHRSAGNATSTPRRERPGLEVRVAQRQPGRVRGRQPGAVIPAAEHGLGVLAQLDQGPQRVPSSVSTTFRLPSAWCSVHSMLPGSPTCRPPGTSGPLPGDERDVGQRLHVLHQGRAAHHARSNTRGGSTGASPGRRWPGWPGRLLARQEPRRRVDDLDREQVYPGRGPVGDRGRSRSISRGLRCTYRPTVWTPPPPRPAAVRPAPGAGRSTAATCPCRSRARLQHRCRPRWAGSGLPPHCQLAVHREGGPAAPGELGGFQFVDQPPALSLVRRVPVGRRWVRRSTGTVPCAGSSRGRPARRAGPAAGWTGRSQAGGWTARGGPWCAAGCCAVAPYVIAYRFSWIGQQMICGNPGAGRARSSRGRGEVLEGHRGPLAQRSSRGGSAA